MAPAGKAPAAVVGRTVCCWTSEGDASALLPIASRGWPVICAAVCGRAIGECVKEAAELAARISTAAKALSGNVLAIIKVVVDEFVHIWQDRKEITDDCKTTAADWRAGDFEGAGAAVGNITKIIIDGLQAEVEVEAA